MSKKKRPRQTAQPGSSAVIGQTFGRDLERELEHADELMESEDLDAALELVLTLDQRHPGNPEVLERLAALYLTVGDVARFVTVSERWYAVAPDSPDAYLTLLGAYILSARPIHAFLHVRKTPPAGLSEVELQDLDESRQTLTAMVEDIQVQTGLTGEHGLEAASLHERGMLATALGHYDEARSLAHRVLALYPDFLPAFNNISVAYAEEGDFDQALHWTQQVLDRSEGNFHALCDAVRLLAQQGKFAEAEHYAQRAKALPLGDYDAWLKRTQALSYMGDDAGVLATFEEARRRFKLVLRESDPTALYLTGVAACRTGNTRQARQLWRSALASNPTFERAQAALDDLALPVGERNGPWPFILPEWIGRRAMDAFRQIGASELETGGVSETRARKKLRQYVQDYPNVVALMPTILDRGDPHGRQFVLTLAQTTEQPDALAAVRDFALSANGPDALRIKALQIATEADVIEPGLLQFWTQGERRELQNLGFEIESEPSDEYNDEVNDYVGEALTLMHEDAKANALRARALLEEAQELEPNSPSIAYNIVYTYRVLGEDEEVRQRIRGIRERYPDYFFGIVSEANDAIGSGDLDRAKKLVDSLLRRRKLHITEFRALAATQLELLLAQRLYDGAQAWIDIWEQTEPDTPDLQIYRMRVNLGKFAQRGEERARKRAERAANPKTASKAGTQKKKPNPNRKQWMPPEPKTTKAKEPEK